jgi:universal stress protein A
MDENRNIAVVGVDLGCTGDDALAEGLRLVKAGMLSKLHLLYVIDPKRVVEPAFSLLESEQRELASAPQRIVHRAKATNRVLGFDIDPAKLIGHARIGDPATTLLQMCADYDADMLIVGTHGRTGLDRILDGSIAEAVVRRAHCPVIVARRKDYSGVSRTVLPDLPYAPGEAPVRVELASGHVQTSTTLDSWHPSDNGPTGFRIV